MAWWKPEWVIDTSRWVHETGTLRLLWDVRTADLNEIAEAHRRLPGPNDHLLPNGRGSVKTDKIKVPNVRYFQGATENIISVAQLSRDHSLETVFEPKYCYIRKQQEQGQVNVGRGRLRKGRYVLDYLVIGEDDATLEAAVAIASDVDDEPSQAQAWPESDPRNLFGLARFDGPTPPMVNNFCCDHVCTGRSMSMTASAQQEPLDHFYMDSGAAFHSTWNSRVIRHYLPQVTPPIESIGGIVQGAGQKVKGYGYISSKDMKFDGVLYIPESTANLVSVGQLTYMYNVKIVFSGNKFWIREFTTSGTMGSGRRLDDTNHYVLDEFRPNKRLYVDEMRPSDSPPAAAPYLSR